MAGDAYVCALCVSVDFSGAGAAAPAGVAASHQRPCPDNHAVRIELRNLAPVGQHRRSREKRSCAGTVGRRPVRIARISKGLIDDARSEVSVGGRSLHGLGERLTNTHLKSLVTIRGAESSHWRNRDDGTPAESATTGKALVRAVARGRGGFPGEVRQCSRKRGEPRIRSFRGTSKGPSRHK